ncbi:hypothetical protein AYI68_g7116, partial [Smittium mucronatum]
MKFDIWINRAEGSSRPVNTSATGSFPKFLQQDLLPIPSQSDFRGEPE